MPLSSTKAGWDDHLVFPRSHGFPSRHAPVRTSAPGMRAITLPVGFSTSRLRSGRWDHLVGCVVLPLHRRGRVSVYELSIPNPRFSNYPPCMEKNSSQFYHAFFDAITTLYRPPPPPSTDPPQWQGITNTGCQWSLGAGINIVHPGLRLYHLDFGNALVQNHPRYRP